MVMTCTNGSWTFIDGADYGFVQIMALYNTFQHPAASTSTLAIDLKKFISESEV